jgi:archaellum component FlaC
LKTDAIDKAELVNGKLAEVENQLSQMTDRHDVLDKEVAQLKVELENSTKMCKDKDSLVDSLRSANKDLHFRLEQQSKFSPPPSVLGTSSEV